MACKERSGFTLIELLVVIAIIGILSTIVMASMSSARSKARDVERKTNLKQLASALEMYHDDRSSYPDTSGAWWGECLGFGSHATSGPTGWIPELAPDYIRTLPTDPRTHDLDTTACSNFQDVCYVYRSDGTDYKLLAHCTPENYDNSDSFYDPIRPTAAWQISTEGGAGW